MADADPGVLLLQNKVQTPDKPFLSETNNFNTVTMNEHLSKVQELQRQLAQKMKRIDLLEQNEVILREQARAYYEDFKSEKSYRELAEARIATLECELAALKQQVNFLCISYYGPYILTYT